MDFCWQAGVLRLIGNITLKKLPGIYQILNTRNQKRYIGLSKDVRNRCLQHRSELIREKHANDYLQKAWSIDGDAFVFDVIEYCNQEMLAEREIFWIDYYDSTNPANGYNHLPGGWNPAGEKASWWGKKHTEETKRKMSESARTRPSNRLPKSPEFVEHLREIFSGENNPFYGKKHTPQSIKIMSEKARAYQQTYGHQSCVRVVKLSEFGELLSTYASVKDAAIAVDRSHCVISDACRGIQKTAAGYRWMYESEYLEMIGGDASNAS